MVLLTKFSINTSTPINGVYTLDGETRSIIGRQEQLARGEFLIDYNRFRVLDQTQNYSLEFSPEDGRIIKVSLCYTTKAEVREVPGRDLCIVSWEGFRPVIKSGNLSLSESDLTDEIELVHFPNALFEEEKKVSPTQKDYAKTRSKKILAAARRNRDARKYLQSRKADES